MEIVELEFRFQIKYVKKSTLRNSDVNMIWLANNTHLMFMWTNHVFFYWTHLNLIALQAWQRCSILFLLKTKIRTQWVSQRLSLVNRSRIFIQSKRIHGCNISWNQLSKNSGVMKNFITHFQTPTRVLPFHCFHELLPQNRIWRIISNVRIIRSFFLIKPEYFGSEIFPDLSILG